MCAKIVAFLAVAAALVSLAGPVAAIAADSTPSLKGRPATIQIRFRSRAAMAPSYTIHDIGAPNGTGAYTSPVAFNNTGQIIGEGGPRNCFVWTGSSFQRLPLPHNDKTDIDCVAQAINDADAAGDYEIVGDASERYSLYQRAFAIRAGASGFKKVTIYYAWAPSAMAGVNGGETALAVAPFSRDGPADPTALDGLLYFTSEAALGSLAQLQGPGPPEGPLPNYLISNFDYTYGAFRACPFGGCAINDRNEVIGYDLKTLTQVSATLAMYTVGEPASLVHLPLQVPVTASYDSFPVPTNFPVAFNNADQLLYFEPSYNAAAIYNLVTKARTIVRVSPPGCQSGVAVPLSLNNLGEALGIVNCPSGASIYWTWNAIHGTKYLNAQLPSNQYSIEPLGVNDKGQILVSLTAASGALRWGTLDPIVPAPAGNVNK